MLKRNTAVLLALALGLALVVLVLTQVDQQQQEQREQESRLFAFAPEEVDQIQIERSGEEATTIQLQRQQDTWQILDPISSQADVFTVDSLLQTASDLQPAEDLEQTGAESDLAAFGLDPAQEILSFTLAQGETQTLQLGKPDFDGTGLYALADDDRLLTIPGSAQARLAPDLFALRDKTLLSLQRDTLQTLEISRPQDPEAEPIRLAQTPSGWQIEAPRVLKVDQATVDQLLTPLLSLQASSFAAETQTDLDTYGLNPPETEIVITLAETATESEPETAEENTEDPPVANEAPVRIALGSTTESGSGTYVITSTTSTIATLPSPTVSALQPTLTQLRDKQLAQIDPEQVVEVTITAADADLSRSLLPVPEAPPETEDEEESENEIEAGSEAEPDTEPDTEPEIDLPAPQRLWEISDQDRVVSLDPLFSALNQAQARDFLSPQDPAAERALEDPLFTLRLGLTETDNRVYRFAEDDDRIYAEVPGRRDILVLERAGLNSIRSALDDLRPE